MADVTGKKWYRPGEIISSRANDNVSLTFERDDGTNWHLTLRFSDRTYPLCWRYDHGILRWQSESIPASAVVLERWISRICKELGQGLPFPVPGSPEHQALDATIAAIKAPKLRTISKSRLHHTVPSLPSEYERSLRRYTEAYLGDQLSVNLNGLLNSSKGAEVRQILDAILKTLRARYAEDPDVSTFTLDEVMKTRGVELQDIAFTYHVVESSFLHEHGTDVSLQTGAFRFQWHVPADIADVVKCRDVDELLGLFRTQSGRRFWRTAPLRLQADVTHELPLKQSELPTGAFICTTQAKCVVCWLPRGLILIEDVEYKEFPAWHVTLSYYSHDGQVGGSTHYHPSYGGTWASRYKVFARSLQIPIADWDYLTSVLLLAQDLRERKPEHSVRHAMGDDDDSFWLVEANRDIFSRMLDATETRSGEYRDLAEGLDEIVTWDAEKAERLLTRAMRTLAADFGSHNHICVRFAQLVQFDPGDPPKGLTNVRSAATILREIANTPPSPEEYSDVPTVHVVNNVVVQPPITGATLSGGAAGPAPTSTPVRSSSSASDPSHMKTAKQVLDEHSGAKCPKCKKTTLSSDDRFDDRLDQVTRTWFCKNCNYSASASRIPISSWQTEHQKRWEAKAAGFAESKAAIRCPNCGNEKIDAVLLGRETIGASSYWQLTCKTSGCDLDPRRIKRSIVAVGKSAIHHVGLVIVLLGSAALLGLIFYYAYQGKASSPPIPPGSTANAGFGTSSVEGLKGGGTNSPAESRPEGAVESPVPPDTERQLTASQIVGIWLLRDAENKPIEGIALGSGRLPRFKRIVYGQNEITEGEYIIKDDVLLWYPDGGIVQQCFPFRLSDDKLSLGILTLQGPDEACSLDRNPNRPFIRVDALPAVAEKREEPKEAKETKDGESKKVSGSSSLKRCSGEPSMGREILSIKQAVEVGVEYAVIAKFDLKGKVDGRVKLAMYRCLVRDSKTAKSGECLLIDEVHGFRDVKTGVTVEADTFAHSGVTLTGGWSDLASSKATVELKVMIAEEDVLKAEFVRGCFSVRDKRLGKK